MKMKTMRWRRVNPDRPPFPGVYTWRSPRKFLCSSGYRKVASVRTFVTSIRKQALKVKSQETEGDSEDATEATGREWKEEDVSDAHSLPEVESSSSESPSMIDLDFGLRQNHH
jgi:hypothetical protein